MKRLYLIGGPMGVGKTTVCRALQRRLERSVFLDGLRARLNTRDCQVRAVSLVASPEALAARLEADIRAGRRNRDALERNLAYLPLFGALETEKLDVSALTPEVAAAHLEET